MSAVLQIFFRFCGWDSNKIDILASLHSSAEGKRAGVTVDGLSTPALIRKVYRAADRLSRRVAGYHRAPATVSSQPKTNREPSDRPAGEISRTYHSRIINC